MVKKTRLVLHGHYAGKTIKLGGTQFTDGKVTLFGATEEIQNLSNYLRKCYQAYEEVEQHGTNQVQETPEPGDTETVSSEIQSDGTGPTTETTDDRTGTNDPHVPGVRQLSSGDGHEDSRISEGQERFDQSSHSKVDPVKLMDALKGMDPMNDELWTSLGKPKIGAVCKGYGSELLTRKDIDAVWPEFTKDLQITLLAKVD